MDNKEHAYIFILALEDFDPNEAYKTLPLHCTLMLWFFCELRPVELIWDVNHLFSGIGPLKLESDRPEMFGERLTVPVHVLKENIELRKLHMELYGVLAGLGVRYLEKKWVGQGFSPHVTTHGGKSFPPGSTGVVRSVHLFEAENCDPRSGTRTHIYEFPL